ncbi:hypothetical protein K461DRAFT_280378 [Myriangium duriaei CBS 260.36]|uniref:Uncharacterized protein n=1 Tax=Myriangium duriaei CBS 260.36 TaxID=1168546 RepID=A0A9P4MK21_9PEZI|nr:hypothetical protein K461DRAFT_280378 [Myriangium duriaei CBS 260.36]
MSASIYTYPLVGIPGDALVSASVINADPTATTIVFKCPDELDMCNGNDLTITATLGPWAQATPPPGASTGIYEANINMGDDPPANIRTICDIASTTKLGACTMAATGITPRGSFYATHTYTPTQTFDAATEGFVASLVPVTITAGLEKLKGVTPSGSATSATTTGNSAQSTTTSPSNGQTSGPAVATQTSSASGSKQSSAASRDLTINMGSMALLGLVVAFFVR